MINKEKFYSEKDYPPVNRTQKIWKAVKKKIKPAKLYGSKVHRIPGFYYGFASAVILFFTLYGLFSFGKNFIYENKPEEIKLTSAYQSAIKEFENVIPAVISNVPQQGVKKDLIFTKMEELKSVNDAIEALKKETVNYDLSPLKQLSLRNLYIIKLKILQQILEQGELSL